MSIDRTVREKERTAGRIDDNIRRIDECITIAVQGLLKIQSIAYLSPNVAYANGIGIPTAVMIVHNLDIVKNIRYVPLHNVNISCIFVS